MKEFSMKEFIMKKVSFLAFLVLASSAVFVPALARAADYNCIVTTANDDKSNRGSLRFYVERTMELQNANCPPPSEHGDADLFDQIILFATDEVSDNDVNSITLEKALEVDVRHKVAVGNWTPEMLTTGDVDYPDDYISTKNYGTVTINGRSNFDSGESPFNCGGDSGSSRALYLRNILLSTNAISKSDLLAANPCIKDAGAFYVCQGIITGNPIKSTWENDATDDETSTGIGLKLIRPWCLALTPILPVHIEDCDDGVDNDGDGAVDCDDSFCENNDACAEVDTEDCDDGVDNDSDGFVDCDDANCSTDPACTGTATDDDGDGYSEDGGDCDDTDATVFPGAADNTCDGTDNDCDGQTDEDAATATYYYDADADGYGQDGVTATACAQPVGYAANPGDCDDTDATVNPGAADDTCDGSDNDCDGTTDEDAATTIYYEDTDGDGYGEDSVTQTACAQPEGYAANPGDCNDADATVNPGAAEVCDEEGLVDEDCDDAINEDCVTEAEVCDDAEGLDEDGDGYSNCFDDDCDGAEACAQAEDCDDGADNDDDDAVDCDDTDCDGHQCCDEQVDDDGDGYTEGGGDCDDADAIINPGASEICEDGIDQDCNGADGECVGEPEVDDDGDGYSEDGGDCDDADATINPGAAETCEDGIDQDCSGADEECGGEPEVDDDGDGYSEDDGDCDDVDATINPSAIETCDDDLDQNCDGFDLTCSESGDEDLDGDGYTPNQGDCDDTNADVNPGADEACDDGIDNDCDGVMIDEGDLEEDGFTSLGLSCQITEVPAQFDGALESGACGCNIKAKRPLTAGQALPVALALLPLAVVLGLRRRARR